MLGIKFNHDALKMHIFNPIQLCLFCAQIAVIYNLVTSYISHQNQNSIRHNQNRQDTAKNKDATPLDDRPLRPKVLSLLQKNTFWIKNCSASCSCDLAFLKLSNLQFLLRKTAMLNRYQDLE